MSRRIAPVIVAFLCLPLIGANGCGGAGAPDGESAKRAAAPELPGAPPPGGKADGKPAADGAKEEAITRKIIYNAVVEVVAKDVEQTRAEVVRIVDEVKGYIAKSDITGQVGTKRTATWTLKVPVDKFQQVVTALAALGQVTKNSSDSQDVTEEYVDLQARIKNMKVEEETLNKFLKDFANNVDSFLKTREQIAKVRGEIERAEGRLKFLTTMSAMSAITFTAREEQSYAPEVPPAAPTFGDSVEGTFANSWKSLQDLGKGAVLLVVALAPWLPLIAAGFFVARFAWRRLARWSAQSEADRLARIDERSERSHRPHRAVPKASVIDAPLFEDPPQG